MSAEISQMTASPLSHYEAIIERGLSKFIEVGNALIAIREGKLYRETHASFDEYVASRWNLSKSRAYQFIEAASVVSNLSTIVDDSCPSYPLPKNEAQARPLAVLPKVVQADAWKNVVTATKGKPTAKAVQDEVDSRLPAKLTSRVNGAESADPPDVAMLRRSGKIPADAVVTVFEPEPIPELQPFESAPDTDPDLSDDEYLATVPILAVLKDRQLRIAKANVLLYRNLTAARKSFHHVASRELNKVGRKGPYPFRVSQFLRTDDPKSWTICPAVEFGGCGGTGSVPLIGECPKCFGSGFKLAH